MRIVYAAVLVVVAVTGCGQPPQEANKAPVPLKDVFDGAFRMGAAMNRPQIDGEAEKDVALIKTHFNSVTAENVMKWENIHPEPGVYDFEAADRLVEFAEANDMHIAGHVLVWHSQVPSWVFDDEAGEPLGREALLERMRDHIQTVVGRYKGRIDQWEAVNEAVNDDGTMRESPWYEIIGEDYVEKAFRYAHEADPDAGLYYNDYSLHNAEKRAGAVKLIKSLQDKNVPITGVGTQGHFGMDYPALDELESTITDFAALGLDVMVTELEVDVLPAAFDYEGADISKRAELQDELNPWPDGLPETMQQKLADRYRELFGVLLDHRDAVSRVTFWGVTDANSWKNNWPVEGRTNYPLLFDRQWRPKPAFHSVVELAREKLPE